MNKAVLITGASSGLGLEFARLYAKDRQDLVLVARNEGKLYEIKNELETQYSIQVYVYAKDLSEDDSALDVYDFILEKELYINILINNAGFGDYGKFINSDLQKQTNMIHVNVLSLVQMCHLFSKSMKQNGGGIILNMCSIAGFQSGALMSVYYATKAFVLSFTEALAVEMKDTEISIKALCPGPTNTGFVGTANLEKSGLFKHIKNTTAEEVANYGFKQMKNKKIVIVHGFFNKILVFGSKILPRAFVRNLVYLIQK